MTVYNDHSAAVGITYLQFVICCCHGTRIDSSLSFALSMYIYGVCANGVPHPPHTPLTQPYTG